MPAAWICDNGHQWEHIPSSPAAENTNPSTCPFCGSSQIRLAGDNAPAGPLKPAGDKEGPHIDPFDETLMPPSKPSAPAAPSSEQPAKPDLYADTLNLPPRPGASSPGDTEAKGPPQPTSKPANSPDPFAETLYPTGKVHAKSHETGEEGPRQQEQHLEDETLQKPRKPGGGKTGEMPAVAGPAPVRGSEESTEKRPGLSERMFAVPRFEVPTIEGYEVQEMLGRGGMGVVYKARQVRLNRPVALKMILSGLYASAQDIARFYLEAEAVATLQHPNIVQIYEIGERNGLPFFSMEYVDGGSLSEKMSGNPWPPDEAARLVEKLARAIFVAHQKGIIHRDLKPANILLMRNTQTRDEQANPAAKKEKMADTYSAISMLQATGSQPAVPRYSIPKITDFGLAKKLDEAGGYTGSGEILGTPQYMAPEQAEGRTRDIGTATDVYALGAILYDMLTGRPPFRGTTIMDTLNQVMFAQPVPPARLRKGIRRDLETICLKCLEKDPKKRYSTAEALADDLQRYLKGRPILARPTPAWERAWKWTKRHPAAAALLVVCTFGLLTLLFGGLAVAQYERRLRRIAVDQRELAMKEKKEAERQFARAEKNYHLALSAVDQMLTRVGQEELAYQPRLSKVRRDLLQKALIFYQKFLAERDPDETIHWETAYAYLRVGHIEEMLGEYEPAKKAFASARKLLSALDNQTPNHAKYLMALGQTHAGEGVVLHATGDTAAAKKELNKAVGYFAMLNRDFPHEEKYKYELAKTHNALGNLHLIDGKATNLAVSAYRESIKLLKPLMKASPTVQYLEENSRVHTNLAAAWSGTHPQEAEKSYLQSQQIQQKLVKLYPDVPEYRKELGRTDLNLGELWRKQGLFKKAERAYGEAEKSLATLVQQFPDVIDFRQLLATTYSNWSILERDQKDFDATREKLQLARTNWEALLDRSPKDPRFRRQLGRNYHDTAIYLAQDNRRQESAALFQKAVDLLHGLVKQFPGDSEYEMDLAKTYLDQGIAAANSNDARQAEKNYQQAVDILEKMASKSKSVPPDWMDVTIRSHTNLALLLKYLKRNRESEKHWRRLVELYQRQAQVFATTPEAFAQLATHELILGQMLKQHSALSEASAWYEKAVHDQQKALSLSGDKTRYRTDLSRNALAWLEILVEMKKYQQVQQAFSEVRADLPKDGKLYSRVAQSLAQCIPLAEEDNKLSREKKRAFVEKCSTQAMNLLQEAVQLGWHDVQALKTDAVFEPLRQREDFQKLVKSVASAK